MSAKDFPVIEGYQIVKHIGRGGMASVYLAIQETFRRNVALKVLSTHLLDDEAYSRGFLREAQTVAQLSHQHIIPVYDVGRCGDFHYIAMEYLPEGDLKRKMQGGLDLQRGLQIIKQVAGGLHYAASKQCVHRDIKPDNILFREDHSPVICDFGIARNNEATQLTKLGSVVGTPHYMSPEQALAQPVDGRSDLYSLAVILFEMLAGELPYSGDSAVSIGISHSTKAIPRLPVEQVLFQPFIDRALAKSPEHRFQTGKEFVHALESVEFNWQTLNRHLDSVHNDNSDSCNHGSKHSSDETVLMGAANFTPASQAQGTAQPEDITVPRTGPGIGNAPADRMTNTGQATFANDFITSHQPPHQATPTPTITAPNSQQLRERALSLLQNMSSVQLTGIACALVVLTVFLGWLASGKTTSNSSGEKSLPFTNVDEYENLTDKVAALNQNASYAIGQEKYYGNTKNDAHYYLTTLLALAPNNAQGKAGINQLFSIYLEKARQSMQTGFYDDGENWLMQANQITYYVGDQALHAEYANLHQQQLAWKQQQLHIAAKEPQINATTPSRSSLDITEKATEQATVDAKTELEYPLTNLYLDSQASQRTQDTEMQRRLQQINQQTEQLIARENIFSPKENNAMLTNQRALALDSLNEPALALQNKLHQLIDAAATTHIAEQQFDRIDTIIASLVELDADPDLIAAIEKDMQQARTTAKIDGKTQDILASIASANAKRVTASNYRELYATYSRALNMAATAQTAKAGARRVNQFVKRKFNYAVQEYDFALAENYLAFFERANGNTSKTRALQNTIVEARQRRSQVMDLLDAADKIIDQPFKKPRLFGSNKANLEQLTSARLKVEAAQSLDPQNPVLTITLGRLEKKYARIIQLYIDSKKYKQARKFLREAKLIKSSHRYLIPLEQRLDS